MPDKVLFDARCGVILPNTIEFLLSVGKISAGRSRLAVSLAG